MPKGQAVLSAVDFVKGWVAGVKAGKTVIQIASSLGMKYGACLARVRSLQDKGVNLPNAVKAPKGKQLSKAYVEYLQQLCREINIEDGLLDPTKE